MAAVHTDDWCRYQLNLNYRGATAPDPAKWRLCLSSSNTLSRSSSKADFVRQELLTQYGYGRSGLVYTADATYNTTQKRAEMVQLSPELTVVSQPIVWQTAFLIADARPEGNVGFNASAISGNNITLAGNGLATGEEIMLSVDGGGIMPTAISPNTIYKAIAVSPTEFAVSVDGSTPLPLSGGSGALRLRYAAGRICWVSIEPSPVTRLVGQRITLNIDAAFGNKTYGSGD